ncbi:hypothetical protein E1293_10835 [Actinomadura darangshiensis]|uniref:Uncharacterized protein n=1 Tax=Actinomadura darangshiensis TaxID=705336 RepID=A0A4R5BJS6_9ACTN|nr:hypothetical protein [Actinomadura darangshiensis]TDD85593.1 hypothetical protein E1293_10835 [Actinomadura darangshiensis]
MIDPEKMPVPGVHLGDVEVVAAALKRDGGRVAGLGHDVDAAWQGLAGVNEAPEAAELFRASRPVVAHGRALGDELGIVGDALAVFVDEVRPVVARLHGLRVAARDFRMEVDGDGDGDFGDWRDDGDKVDRNNKLSNDALVALAQYQEAERACANKITAIFGGTRFVPSGPFIPRGREKYGLGEVPQDVETPWATPQERDKPWYEDVWDGFAEFGEGAADIFGDLVGLHGQDGWLNAWGTEGSWWGNIKGNYPRMLVGLGNLERSLGTRDGWVELAHSIVPWREWDDRPGYVITHGGLSGLALLFAGKSLSRFKRTAPGGFDLFPGKGLGGKLDRPADLNTAHSQTLGHINVGRPHETPPDGTVGLAADRPPGGHVSEQAAGVPSPRTTGPAYPTTPMSPRFVGEDLPGNEIWDGSRVVRYLDAFRREGYRIWVDDEGLLRDTGGRLYDTTESSWRSKALFVMDRLGNIYASRTFAPGGFHHSSFLAGGPVTAAGELTAVNGRLEMINDFSGHYKPNVEDMTRTIERLRAAGVAISDDMIRRMRRR